MWKREVGNIQPKKELFSHPHFKIPVHIFTSALVFVGRNSIMLMETFWTGTTLAKTDIKYLGTHQV